VRTFQASSADPTGGNDDGFTGQYSCRTRLPQGCLLAQHRGPGELEAVWSAGSKLGNVAFEGRLRIELDGRMVVDAPFQDVVDGRLGPPFVAPLVLTGALSSGGWSVDVPMPFRHRMRVFTEGNPRYFHVVYRAFATARGVRTFTARDTAPDVLRALRGAGTRDRKPPMGSPVSVRRSFRVAPGRRVVLATLHGSGAVTRLRLRIRRYGASSGGDPSVPPATDAWRRTRLLMSFDGHRTVDAPLGEFFGSGLGPARVRSLLFASDGGAQGWATSWWPMPHAASVVVALRNASHTPILAGDLRLTDARAKRWRAALGPHGDAMRFHARGHAGLTRRGVPWTLLRTSGAGTFAGATLTMEGASPPRYLEGDEQGWVDGALRPQLQGTGTEDFFGGGWYFYDRLFSLPLSGFSAHATRGPECPTPTCNTAYRVMVGDAVPFTRSLRYVIEHGAANVEDAVYSSTAYWYAR
jgi:hypothetical protein